MVIGIAVNAMLVAVSSWIVLRAELEVAMAATGRIVSTHPACACPPVMG